MKLLINIGVLIGAILLTLLVFESVAMILEPNNQNIVYNKKFISDDGIEIEENGSVSGWYLQYHNGIGKKVVVIGDSFTAGAGVEDFRQSFPMQLSDLVQNHEFFFYADGGLNTYQEYILLRDFAIKDYDEVIVQFTPNDGEPIRTQLGHIENDGTRLYVNSKAGFIKDSKFIAPMFPGLNYKLNYLILSNSAFSRFVSRKINIMKLKDQVDIEKCIESMKLIKDNVKGSRMTIINFPLAMDLDTCSFEIVDRVREFSFENNVTFIDLCDRMDLDEVRSELEYDDPQGHYNAKGYRIAAESLRDVLIGEKTSGKTSEKEIGFII